MKLLILGVTLLSLSIVALPLNATTLSVVPLAEALQNSELAESNRTSDSYWAAVNAVRSQMLNQPAEFPSVGKDAEGKPVAPELDEEQAGFCTRLTNLAKYRHTRVGKLFFAALAATPGIENVAEGAEFVAITASWPLALGSMIRVRVEWSSRAGEWRISALEVTMDGVAAAPVTGMAPYFGSGELREEMLDFGPIDYLVGRNPADRERPDSERPVFDYSEAVAKLLKAEEGALERVIKKLKDEVKPGVERKDRLAALKQHLATDEEREAAVAADADPDLREDFWNRVYAQIEDALAVPRPGSVPEGRGAEVQIRYRLAEGSGTTEGKLAAIRLQSGKVAVRGSPDRGKEASDGNEGNSSGD